MTYSKSMSNSGTGSQWLTCRVQYLDDTDPFSSTNFPEPTRPPSYTFNVEIPLGEQLAGIHRLLKAPHKIDDCTLQLSNSHAYLDLDLSISEQKEEFESFYAEGKRNSVILRTLLSLRVHACIEKLYNSKGRELRRALFSLKQVFQDDKDLVHQFVEADGLTCLIKVGAEADQNYQNYILRALGQIMLYIDGMEGVIRHMDTIRWLYSLLASKFRLVVKTALKLLLVFVEYSESNAQVLIQAIRHVDSRKGQPTWHNLIAVLKDKDAAETELLVYSMTLINKTLSNIPDQDTFYDITDALEEQKIDEISQYHQDKKGSDVDLIEQFKIYEMALKHEDGDDDVVDPTSAGSAIKWNRERRKSEVSTYRKSKRSNSICVGSIPVIPEIFAHDTVFEQSPETKDATSDKIIDPNKSPKPWMHKLVSKSNSLSTDVHLASPILPSSDISEERERRRRERMAKWSEREKSYRRQVKPSLEDIYQNERNKLERRRNLLNTEKSMQAASQNGHVTKENKPDLIQNAASTSPPPPPVRKSLSKALEKGKPESKRQELQEQVQNKVPQQERSARARTADDPVTNGDVTTVSRPRRRRDAFLKTPLPQPEPIPVFESNNGETHFPSDEKEMESLRSRLRSTNDASSPTDVAKVSPLTKDDRPNDVITNDQKLLMDMLYANRSVALKQTESDDASDEMPSTEAKSPLDLSVEVKAIRDQLKTSSTPLKNGNLLPSKCFDEMRTRDVDIVPESTKKDSDVMWEKLVARGNHKTLKIDGFDFSGLSELDDHNVLSPTAEKGSFKQPAGIPPPPPAVPPPPPPPIERGPPPPPPPPPGVSPSSSPMLGMSAQSKRRTIRLFWKEASELPSNPLRNKRNVWSDIEDVEIEADQFINLFLLKNKEAGQRKPQNEKKNELRVLDVKRSNAINIGMTILPPPRTIKSAIINMDEFALTKEQIDKLLTMVPTEEEISSIQEAMQMSPDVALGSAEQFLLTLSSISELQARLSLWAFKLDYDVLEKEVAEPLQDLKDAIEELKSNKTLRRILGILRSIGNLLNGTSVKGFELSYLGKVPEVKDTVHKQTLLQHLTQCVLEKFPDCSDLYSELGPVTRCSRVDFEVLEETLQAMEEGCKSSWDHLKVIAKHESKAAFRSKLSDFLMNCAQKIITLKLVHSRLKNRFHAMLLYFGTSLKTINEMTIQGFMKILSEFSLEYRTTKERVESQRKKRFQRGERNRTRGKTILEQDFFLSDSGLSDDEKLISYTQNFSTTEEEVKQKLLENAVTPPAGLVEKRPRSRLGRARKSEDLGVMLPMQNLLKSPENNDVTDQIMEQLVKTATQTPRDHSTVISRRRRSRNSQRKSLRRTLKNGLTDEEKAAVLKSH